MTRYLIHLAFKGTQYKGWQWQTDQPSVQQTIEDSLAMVTGKPVKIHGCGRTDAGVHASQYFAHADIPIPDKSHFIYVMNKNLPADIRFLEILDVPGDFNAQMDVISRTYRYFFHFKPDPILEQISCFSPADPEDERLVAPLNMIKGTHDFRQFTRTPDRQTTTLVDVQSARTIRSKDGSQLCFEFKANHFLRAMVRLLVSELMAIGSGEKDLPDFKKRLNKIADPKNFPKPAYPQGLYLSGVEYPVIRIPGMVSEAFSL